MISCIIDTIIEKKNRIKGNLTKLAVNKYLLKKKSKLKII